MNTDTKTDTTEEPEKPETSEQTDKGESTKEETTSTEKPARKRRLVNDPTRLLTRAEEIQSLANESEAEVKQTAAPIADACVRVRAAHALVLQTQQKQELATDSADAPSDLIESRLSKVAASLRLSSMGKALLVTAGEKVPWKRAEIVLKVLRSTDLEVPPRQVSELESAYADFTQPKQAKESAQKAHRQAVKTYRSEVTKLKRTLGLTWAKLAVIEAAKKAEQVGAHGSA